MLKSVVLWYYFPVPPDEFDQLEIDDKARDAMLDLGESLEDWVEDTIQTIVQRIVTEAEKQYEQEASQIETQGMDKYMVLTMEHGTSDEEALYHTNEWLRRQMRLATARLELGKQIARANQRALLMRFYSWRQPQYELEEVPYL